MAFVATRCPVSRLFVVALLTTCAVCLTQGRVCNVDDYGAEGDGITDDTQAIQAAIDDCADTTQNNIVTFASGKSYFTGHIVVHSGVHLHILDGATILANPDRNAYPGSFESWYLISVSDCQGCKITGAGNSTIDGQSDKFVTSTTPYRKAVHNWADPSCKLSSECRPRLVGIVDSEDIVIQGITLLNAAYWTLHIHHSINVTVQNVSIFGDLRVPNNDGIDIDGSRDVVVSDCRVETGDDAICLKTTSGLHKTENVLVKKCEIISRSSAVKIGSETVADITNITVVDVSVIEAHRGLAICLRDSGNIRDVTFSGVTVKTTHYDWSWWGAAEPIYVTALPRRYGSALGNVSNIKFTDIDCHGEAGVFIAGYGEHLQDVALHDIHMDLVALTAFDGGYHDYRPGEVGILQGGIEGLHAEFVQQIDMHHVKIHFKNPKRSDWSSAMYLDPGTVRSVSMTEVHVADERASAQHAAIVDERVIVQNLRYLPSVTVILVFWSLLALMGWKVAAYSHGCACLRGFRPWVRKSVPPNRRSEDP